LGAEFLELSFPEDGTGEGGYAKVMSDEFRRKWLCSPGYRGGHNITTALIPGKTAPVLIRKWLRA